jgi:hypothetical protein
MLRLTYDTRNGVPDTREIVPPQTEVFYVHHVAYPPGGLTPEERGYLLETIEEAKQIAAHGNETLEFAFPGNINPDTWKAAVSKHCYGWRWTNGLAYRQEKRPEEPSAKPSPMKRYFASLSKAFPEQASRLQEAMKASEGPRADPAHLLKKTPGYENLFRNRPWVSPTEALLGTGGLSVFCVADTQRFFDEAGLVTGQKENIATRGASFLLPVFTRQSFMMASRDTLRQWFGLFNLYLLEYVYAEGLLIASPTDLSHTVQAFEDKLRSIPGSTQSR